MVTIDFVANLLPLSATVDFQQSRPCWIQLCRKCVPGLTAAGRQCNCLADNNSKQYLSSIWRTSKYRAQQTYVDLWTFWGGGTKNTDSVIHSRVETGETFVWWLQCCGEMIDVTCNTSIQRELELRWCLLHNCNQVDFVLFNRCKLLIQCFLHKQHKFLQPIWYRIFAGNLHNLCTLMHVGKNDGTMKS